MMINSHWAMIAASSEFRDAVEPLAVVAVIIILVVLVLSREGHNAVLEQILAENDFGPPEAFRGNLIVRDYKPGVLLKLGPDTVPVTWRKRLSRLIWPTFRPLFVARIRKADFDSSTRQIKLGTKHGVRIARFEEFSAIRMREFAGRNGISFWIIQLMPQKGRPIRIVESPHGGRQAAFEHTAPLLKAISTITGLPMHVHVAGNVWTPGWPPKAKPLSQSDSRRRSA